MADQYRLPPPLFPPRTPQTEQEMPQWAKAIQDSIRNLYQTLANRLEGLVTVGLIADRPPANGSFRFYLALDTKTLYFDDGVWSSFEGTPDIVQPTWNNVKDFGAIGDGVTSDNVAIQNAINAGSSVFFPPGVYLISSTLVVPSSTYVWGKGAILVLGNNVNDNLLVTASGATDITIAGLVFDGNAANNALTPEFQSLLYVDSNLGIAPCSNIVIRDCVVTNSYQACIQFGSGAVDCQIIDNKIGPSTENGGINIARGDGECQRILVAGNVVTNTGLAGIGATSPISDCAIVGNIIRSSGTGTNTADNITAYAPGNHTLLVAGNVCSFSENHNIHIGGDNLTVTGNVCRVTTDGGGIFLGLTSTIPPTPSDGAVITGNSMFACRRGISVWNMRNVTISGNTVRDCIDQALFIQSTGATPAQDRLLINGNNINHGNSEPAIQIVGAMDHGVVSNNFIFGHGTALTAIQLHSGASNLVISGNRITNFTTAIDEGPTSNNNLITGNHLAGNAIGISLGNSASTTVCSDNRSPVLLNDIAVAGSGLTILIRADVSPFVRLTAAAAASINDFIPKWPGRVLYLYFGDSNITLNTASGTLYLAGGTNKTGSANDIIQLVSDGTAWFQASTLQANS